jgi:hypothetical protein
MSQDELVVARRQPAVDGRFWELRADRVSGANLFKKDAVLSTSRRLVPKGNRIQRSIRGGIGALDLRFRGEEAFEMGD